MSGIKKSLKAAKKSIEENDPQSALEFVEEALELDNSNYFAIIFQGKAYQLLNEPAKASKSFIKATSLEPDNLLGWKGYFQVLRSQSDYNEFFKVATELIRKQIDQGIGIADTIKDIRNYLSQNNFKSNKDLNEAFLRSVLPGSDLGNLVGSDLGRPEDNLKALIELVKRDEAEKVSKALSSEKMKLPRVLTPEQKLHLSNITWAFYKESDLSQLYEEFLNISNDDSLREQFKEDLLKYKYEVVKVCPEKEQLFQEIKEMVEGMILLKTKSLFCWTLYFDWSDVTDLARIDFENIIFFLKNFENEGLGMVLYSFLMSDISPFDKARILRGIGSEKNQSEYENPLQTEDAVSLKEDSELIEPEEQTPSDQPLPPAQVLSLMLKGFSKCEHSIMANRIICGYYVHLHEYTEALERCRGAIKLLADVQRTCGIDLVNTREDILCSLAITYTFYEAPKNFARALQLYERVLTRNEKNIKARIGKALILVEKNDLHGAMGLLSTVVEENPNDPQALIDYCWCQVKLGDYSPGRLGLIKALTLVQGTDLYSRELRAVIQWRIAKSFLLPDNDKDKGIEIINKAYHYLIRSLKDANNYAPSYTLLGVLYHDYYGDKQRAHKCFYKAFELDESELLAAKYLVDDFTSRNEWNIAEILCKRIANSERSRRIMYNKQHEYSDSCWPYRVLGCSSLNIQDDGKAIEWFQAALRISPADVDCWSGLGEAYFNCGRFDAAAKVFRHTLTIDGDSWTTNYFFGHVLCEMEEFEEGFKHLNRALKIQKNEATLHALYKSHIDYTNKLILGGFFGRAIESNIRAIDFILQASKITISSQSLWIALGDSLKVFLVLQDSVDQLPLDALVEIFKEVDFESNSNSEWGAEMLRVDGLKLETALRYYDSEEKLSSVSTFIILSSKAALLLSSSKGTKLEKSSICYNLGLSYLQSFNLHETSLFRDLAIKSLKKAIRLESHTSAFWLALGNAFVSSNPQAAQHCFIKAIALESRDASIWVNLAALYLRYGDALLAKDAFTRAQSVAPQLSLSWLGNALTEQALGDPTKASNLFTHAFIVSNGRSSFAQLLYALSVIDKRIKSGSSPRDIETAQEFSVANFAMKSYLKCFPRDVKGLEVAFTVSERCQDYTSGVNIATRLCEILEKQYEITESNDVLCDFAKAKTRLARVYLGTGEYEKALESAELTIALLDDDENLDDGDKDLESIMSPDLLSSRIIMGLCHFFKDDFNAALDQFKLILASNDDTERLVTFVAQVLYAYGTQDTKQAAVDQLFNFLDQYGSSLMVVLTLGALSIIDNLTEFLPAIKEEMNGLSLKEISSDTFRNVPRLINEIDKRIQSSDEKIWQKSAILFPSDFTVWKQLSPQMALKVASLTETKLTAYDFAQSNLAIGNLRLIQRSLILFPSYKEAQRALDGCF